MRITKNAEIKIWRACAIEEYDRMQFWARLIKAFIEYQHGHDAIIGIGIKRLSEIMTHTVNHPESRKVALKEITDWAMANMWKFHVEISNDYAIVYHLKRINNPDKL